MTTMHATGTFEVAMTPTSQDESSDAMFGRMILTKTFHGDLEAQSHGQMLTAGTEVQGSAGYVAIERVTGSLRGLSGSFILQHNGLMTRGAPQLTIIVIPDSGTEQLKGLAGTVTITIDDGKHFYDLAYTLDEAS